MGLSEQDWALISADGDRAKLCASRFPRVLARLLDAARAEEAEAQARRVTELERQLEVFADFADLIDAETSGFTDCDPVALVLVPDEKSPVEMTRFPISAFRNARALLPTDTKEPSDDR